MHKAVTVTIRILSDVLAFVVCISLLVFIAMGVLQRIQPISQGYFADDYSIRLPRHSSTVSSVTLYSVSSVLILTTVNQVCFSFIPPQVVAVEVMIGWDSLRMKKAGIPVVLYSIYDYLLVAFYGYFVTITITDVGKAAVGRLRPSFFDQCGPNVLQSTVLGYITDYSCTSGSEKDHLDARKSFPSGHSSLAIYSALFLCIYLQLRQSKFRIPALRVAAQTVFLSLAIVTCITRITDYRHHVTDVLAGAVLGLLVAVSVPFYMCHLFRPNRENQVRPLCTEQETDKIPTNRTSLVNIRMLDAAEAAARRLRNPVPCVQNLEVNRHEFVDLKTAHPVSQMSSQHYKILQFALLCLSWFSNSPLNSMCSIHFPFDFCHSAAILHVPPVPAKS
ncbi:PAP2 family protein [Opisthorchis viverrini]|uniref:PAP2 family protein n=1 Tax=Opisthorchis viverrini TaxID=6198 RepID=A0A1S8XBM7_OPIVI|nr:PAP2 family protein [Opisthorchis viverrini]